MEFNNLSGLFKSQKLFSGTKNSFLSLEKREILTSTLVLYQSENFSDPLKTLFENIKKACLLSDQNSVSLNQSTEHLKFEQLSGHKLRKILIFGSPTPFLPASVGFKKLVPFSFGDYQILVIHDLEEMNAKPETKAISWKSLKAFFEL